MAATVQPIAAAPKPFFDYCRLVPSQLSLCSSRPLLSCLHSATAIRPPLGRCLANRHRHSVTIRPLFGRPSATIGPIAISRLLFGHQSAIVAHCSADHHDWTAIRPPLGRYPAATLRPITITTRSLFDHYSANCRCSATTQPLPATVQPITTGIRPLFSHHSATTGHHHSTVGLSYPAFTLPLFSHRYSAVSVFHPFSSI